MSFREKIITLRDEHNLSQQELSEMLDVSRQTVSRWESGKSIPSASQVSKICKAFNVNADFLLDTDVPAQTQNKKPRLTKTQITLISVAGALLLLAVIGLIITIVYAVKDAAYDASTTVWIVAIPRNTPMIVLSLFLGVFIVLLAVYLILTLRRTRK